MHHVDVFVAYFLVSYQQPLVCKVLVRPLDLYVGGFGLIKCVTLILYHNKWWQLTVFIFYLITYFNASWFIIPKAFTAASRTSATSHLSSGTTNLYRATGDGEIVFDLSLRSAFNESGDELLIFTSFSWKFSERYTKFISDLIMIPNNIHWVYCVCFVLVCIGVQRVHHIYIFIWSTFLNEFHWNQLIRFHFVSRLFPTLIECVCILKMKISEV